MSEVLVVADHVDSHVSKPAFELLTLARRLGEPVAVVFGDTDDTIAKALGEYGASRVLCVNDTAIDAYLVAPKAEALAQIAATVQPAAVLITSSPEGKEIAGRLAVKLGSGLITDATDIAAEGSTTECLLVARNVGDPGPDPTVEVRRHRVLTDVGLVAARLDRKVAEHERAALGGG